MTDADAIAVLQTLSGRPGALKIITATHRCVGDSPTSGAGGKGQPTTEEELAACDAFEATVKEPGHFVVHDVVSLDGPDADGFLRAFTAEGDMCMGRPAALLSRLTEAGGSDQ